MYLCVGDPYKLQLDKFSDSSHTRTLVLDLFHSEKFRLRFKVSNLHNLN